MAMIPDAAAVAFIAQIIGQMLRFQAVQLVRIHQLEVLHP
jgi:hypothetical protein